MKVDGHAQFRGGCSPEIAIGTLEERAWILYYEQYQKYKATPDLLSILMFALSEHEKEKKA